LVVVSKPGPHVHGIEKEGIITADYISDLDARPSSWVDLFRDVVRRMNEREGEMGYQSNFLRKPVKKINVCE